MGLFDFVKDAGAKLVSSAEGLFGGDAEAEARAADDLAKTVAGLGLPVRELNVGVKDDVATVSGVTPSQTDREKIVLAVGNTRGIAKVDDRLVVQAPAAVAPAVAAPAATESAPATAESVPAAAESAPAEPAAQFYTVQRGDTLSGIAKAQYGDAMKYPALFEANRPMLQDPNKIYPGQVLRVPAL